MTHVFPVGDKREHILEGDTCPCGPRVEYVCPQTGLPYEEPICVHHAWDLREALEEVETLPEVKP